MTVRGLLDFFLHQALSDPVHLVDVLSRLGLLVEDTNADGTAGPLALNLAVLSTVQPPPQPLLGAWVGRGVSAAAPAACCVPRCTCLPAPTAHCPRLCPLLPSPMLPRFPSHQRLLLPVPPPPLPPHAPPSPRRLPPPPLHSPEDSTDVVSPRSSLAVHSPPPGSPAVGPVGTPPFLPTSGLAPLVAPASAGPATRTGSTGEAGGSAPGSAPRHRRNRSTNILWTALSPFGTASSALSAAGAVSGGGGGGSAPAAAAAPASGQLAPALAPGGGSGAGPGANTSLLSVAALSASTASGAAGGDVSVGLQRSRASSRHGRSSAGSGETGDLLHLLDDAGGLTDTDGGVSAGSTDGDDDGNDSAGDDGTRGSSRPSALALSSDSGDEAHVSAQAALAGPVEPQPLAGVSGFTGGLRRAAAVLQSRRNSRLGTLPPLPALMVPREGGVVGAGGGDGRAAGDGGPAMPLPFPVDVDPDLPSTRLFEYFAVIGCGSVVEDMPANPALDDVLFKSRTIVRCEAVWRLAGVLRATVSSCVRRVVGGGGFFLRLCVCVDVRCPCHLRGCPAPPPPLHTHRLPEKDYPSRSMPDLAEFCFPEGLRLYARPKPAEVFHQVFTGLDGVRLFCTCLRTYEPQRPYELASRFLGTVSPQWASTGVYYVPQAMALVSCFGFFTAFRRVLCQLLRLSLGTYVHIEKVLALLLTQVPVPPRGGCSVGFTLGDQHFVLARPPANHLPMFDAPMSPLFHCLDVKNVMTVGVGCVGGWVGGGRVLPVSPRPRTRVSWVWMGPAPVGVFCMDGGSGAAVVCTQPVFR
jgi:hypothetical protein